MGRKQKRCIAAVNESRRLHCSTDDDQNLRHQQNLQQAGVAVIVLVASSNRLSDLIPLLPDVRNVLNTIASGEVIEIGGS